MLTQGIPDISHLKYWSGSSSSAWARDCWPSPPSRRWGAVVRASRRWPRSSFTLTGFGLLRFFGVIHTAGQYLTLSF